LTLASTCPGCGAPLEFRLASSVVMVCAHCRSVVARTDRAFERIGEVADLVDTQSQLAVGREGSLAGESFVLTGRAQLQHPAGGVWDEWYALFSDGRMGWLAEAQGRFQIYFEARLERPPPFEALFPGAVAALEEGHWIVVERNEAQAGFAEGEIPYRLEPGEPKRYADLSGPSGQVATLDYGDEPARLYVGREVTLDELGLAPTGAPKEPSRPRTVTSATLDCPNCKGALALRAPDRTERVGCPYCGALLDVNQRNLVFLQLLDESRRPKPVLPLGATGEWENHTVTVIGFLVRSVTIEEVRYSWEEYLLYEPRLGFRWLVRSDDHWSWVKPLSAGDITEQVGAVLHRGRRYRLFQSAAAEVDYVTGEFYWKVEAGERVQMFDYVHPPEMLSCEQGESEMTWSLAAYVPPAEIERRFGVRDLPRPMTVAPNQPAPGAGVFRDAAILFAIALALVIALGIVRPRRTVYQDRLAVEPPPSGQTSVTVETPPFEIAGHRSLEVRANALVSNSWLALDGHLVNVESGITQSFELPIEFYSGVESGESWSEGSRSTSARLPALPAGRYTLVLEAEGQALPTIDRIEVSVREGGWRTLWSALLFGGLLVCPILALVRRAAFESRRWQDSNVTGGSDQSPSGQTVGFVIAVLVMILWAILD
jgi:hypothetical protein